MFPKGEKGGGVETKQKGRTAVMSQKVMARRVPTSQGTNMIMIVYIPEYAKSTAKKW